MTLPTHNRPFLFLFVTAFTIGMKSFHQGRFIAGSLQLVTFRALLVLG